MRRTSVLLLCAVAALARPDGQVIMTGNGTLAGGVRYRYETAVEPRGGDGDSHGGGFMAVGDTLHRYLCQETTLSCFGYDLTVKPGDEPFQVKASFAPLTVSKVRLPKRNDGKSWKVVPIPKYPPLQLVSIGETIALDLMVSSDGRKLVDYIDLEPAKPAEPPAARATGEARDFTADDGPLHVDDGDIAVRIDGRPYDGEVGITVKPGATFWFAIPNQGRYLLSLTPRDGFRKAGAIRSNVIAFSDGRHDYEFRFNAPLAGRAKAWNLYLLHEPGYHSPRNAITGGLDRLESLLKH